MEETRVRDLSEPTLRALRNALSIILLPGIMLAGFAAAMLRMSGARLHAPAILGLAYGGMVLVAAGFVFVRWTIGQNAPARLALAIVLGSIVTSLVLLSGCLLTGQRAGTVFGWWSILVAGMFLGSCAKARGLRQIDFEEASSVLAVGLLVALWCRRSARLLPILKATGVFSGWSDYFFHAAQIAQFGDQLGGGKSSFLLVQQPIEFYHYAAYMLPAAVASLVNTPALGIATSVLLPYGIMLTALGSYTLVRRTAAAGTSLLAPFALLFLPDASQYGLQNGFFGFHWLLFSSPGSGYGIGVAFASLALVADGRSCNHRASLWSGLLVMATLFEFRAQIFLLFAPALLLTLLWETRFICRRARLAASVLLTTIAVSVLGLMTVPAVREAWLRFSECREALEAFHAGQQPTAYDGMYHWVGQHFGQEIAWVLGISILIPVVLGAITVALPLAAAGAVRRTGWRSLDSFPFWCLASWLALVLLAPTAAYGNGFEYQHRPFVLAYAVALVWTLLFADRAICTGRLFRWRMTPVPFAFYVAILGICMALIQTADPARPRFEWGKRYFGSKMEPGLMAAASFVHAQAVAGDIFALIPTDRSNIIDDAVTRFAALANVPAYVAHPANYALKAGRRGLVAEEREVELERVEAADHSNDALSRLQADGVRFLVVLGEHGPRFDPDRSMAAFQARDAAVYRTVPARPPDR